MSDDEKYIKSYSVKIIVSLLLVFIIIIPFIVVGTIYEESNEWLSSLMGWICISTVAISLILITIYAIIGSKKVNAIKVKILHNAAKKRTFLTEFNDIVDGKKYTFSNDGICVDDITIPYDNIRGAYIVRGVGSILYTISELIVSMWDDTSEDSDLEISIVVNGDLLDLIKAHNIIIENQDRLDYLLEHPETIKKINVPRNQANPLAFAITKDEKRIVRKAFAKYWFIWVIIWIAMFCAGFAIKLANETKKGLTISELLNLSLLAKIGISAVMLFLAFYKNKNRGIKPKLLTTISICFAVSIYWILLLLDTVYIYFVMVLVSTYLLGLAIYYAITVSDTIKHDSLILALVGALYAFSIMLKMININYTDWVLFILSGIVTGIIFIPTVICGILYYFKRKDRFKDSKKRIEYFFTILFAPIMFGYIYSLIIIATINYSFDYCEGVSYTYQITDMEKTSSGKSTDYYIYINRDDNNRISVDNDDYFSFEIGDTVIITKHEGALHISYEMYEKK